MESWMNVAGRKIVLSITTPGSAGFISSSTFSTPVVTSSVFPQGCFSTMSKRPSPSLMTASPINGGVPTTTSATSPRRMGLPPRNSTTVRARSSGVSISGSCVTLRRWFGVSMKPPALITAASPAARVTASSVTPAARSRCGSTST